MTHSVGTLNRGGVGETMRSGHTMKTMNTLNSLNVERINQRNDDRLKDFEARGSGTVGAGGGGGGGGVTGYRFSDPKDELAQLDSMLMDMISKDPGGGGGSAGDFYGSSTPILAGMRESKPQFDPPMASIHEEFNEQTVKFDDNGFRFS